MPKGVYVRKPRSPESEVRRITALRAVLLGRPKSAEHRAKLTKHGHSRSATYRIWQGMIQRCTNPNVPKFRHWGGRGIWICYSWLSFTEFLRDMGERPEGKTLDRIDNDGPYLKSNCRWATVSEQNSNRRRIAA